MEILIKKEDTTKGSLILVTPEYPINREPEAKEMVPAIPAWPEICMQERAAVLLQQLLKELDCKNQIAPVSGFRTQKEQIKIWEDSIVENGPDFTRKFVARPGHSEHQTGLAIDLAKNQAKIDFICPDFPETGVYQSFREAAPRFGFVERYPGEKEGITGIGKEPWHFRYTGFPHSAIMAEKGMVLEEYIAFLKNNTEPDKPYCYYEDEVCIEIGYFRPEDTEIIRLTLPEGTPYLISGTNEGGMVISLWRNKNGC